ncbi:hypothetical protein EDD18DRAFT_1345640 [Armillaria luteobubalina]|uniref:Uncharacterized protein n=1 Tax=Armillaria luteobubalina TaxID=153913 RepID=A0AA39QJ42_9AGAR|nr:hypothetical protein EDD18DRAFT_1345640 [Armillaria luteobubalina]
MSLTFQPHRARCIQVTDGTVVCPCPWFNAPSLPSLDQFSCVGCGHGIHAHVDYDSKIVHHRPTNYCAAYAQKACTCTVQLFDHEPIVNVYRSLALSHSPALIASSLDSITPHNVNIAAPSDDTGTHEVILTSTPIPSLDDSPSGTPNCMLFAPDPVPSHSDSVTDFSQSAAYTAIYRQQSDDASYVRDLAGDPTVHHAPEDYYDYQCHTFGMDGEPSTGQ